jgi:hypothetical protein
VVRSPSPSLSPGRGEPSRVIESAHGLVAIADSGHDCRIKVSKTINGWVAVAMSWPPAEAAVLMRKACIYMRQPCEFD